jgi:hypothetical protein
MDDFPSKFKQLGYYNLMVWPSGFESDKKSNFIYRGRNQVLGPDHLSKFPKWFDEVH